MTAQHEQIAEEVAKGFDRVIGSTSFILGSEVEEFEREFAAFSQIEHCIGVANGTDALELALRALEIGPGDEVILPANTFIASALAAVRAGASVVLVDCDPIYQLIDVAQVSREIGPRTKAIMPVHLFGQVAPMEELQKVADDAGVPIVEDAAQAHGAKRNGRGAGGFGQIAATSFYPGKNLGAYGDAGAIMTNSDELAARVSALRNYGSDVKYHHPQIGFNSRLDTLQAVVLRAKLKHLAEWNEQRRLAAARYGELLSDIHVVVLPAVMPGNEHIWHLYVVRVPRRDEVLQAMQQSGIGVGIHYPVPIHLQGAFESLGKKQGDFPNAEGAADSILSLPMYAEITAGQQARVAQELRRALS